MYIFSECWLPITDMTSLFLRYDASTVLTILDGDRMFSYDPESPLYSQKGWRSAVDDPEPSLIVVFRYKHSDTWYCQCFSWTKISNHGINVGYQKTGILVPIFSLYSHSQLLAVVTPRLLLIKYLHQCFSDLVNVAGFDILPYSVDSIKVMLSEDGTTWSTYSEAGQDKVHFFQSSPRTNRQIVTIIHFCPDLKEWSTSEIKNIWMESNA